VTPRLFLVRHSLPELRSDVEPRLWRLSEEGQRRCRLLADRLRPYAPRLIVSSIEHKAVETAAVAASELGLAHRVGEGLEEHHRHGVGFLSRDELERRISAFFDRPRELVFGSETAEAALRRFSDAVRRELAAGGEGQVVVAHGTVISLYVTSLHPEIDPFELWKRLGTPALVALGETEVEIVASV